VTEKKTMNMTLPGSTEPVPVTYQLKPMLALYDEKGEVRGMLDDDSLSFTRSHVSLGNGTLSIGDQNAGVMISAYNVGLFDEQGFEAALFDKNKNVIWKAP